MFRNSSNIRFIFILFLPLFCLMCVPTSFAQVSAAISGVVTDASGSVVQAASVTAKDLETSAVRHTTTDTAGRYQLLELAVGSYEVTVTKDGFRTIVRSGINLVVGQEARIDFSLQVGEVTQRVTVTEELPAVDPTTTDISGLVGEQQVKNLPLNGRSYDLLTLLNPGVVNFTWEKTGGIGISNSTTANMFSVSGNRPQQNLFLLNGVEFTGAAENNMTPGGASGQLLGIDAVREFNILRDDLRRRVRQEAGRPDQHRDAIRHESVARLAVRVLAQQRLGRAQFLRCRFFRSSVSEESVWRLDGRPDPEGQDLCVRQLRGIPSRICTRPPWHSFPTRSPGWTPLPL